MLSLDENGEYSCSWEECDEYQLTASGPKCLECEEGWGLREENGFCYRCPHKGAWNDC